MPVTPHLEKHFSASAQVRDIVIGMADGPNAVPFALAAGLSGAISSTAIIITAGLAEVAAGGLAMSLGGYLAAQTDLEHYHSELQREKAEIKQVPKTERAEVRQILREQGLDPVLTETVTAALTHDPRPVDQFHDAFRTRLGRAGGRPGTQKALSRSAAPMSSAVLFPLAALFPAGNGFPRPSFVSIALTLAALLIFGGVKGQLTGVAPLRSALQTAIVGSLAAAAAFAIARIVGR